MILPSKHVPVERSLLGLGADVLSHLSEPKTTSRLWDEIRASEHATKKPVPYDWFILALSFLYTIDAIEFHKGRIRRSVAQ
ncbi:ABC-three component system middle component 6 [Roseiconus lacunae]|uniref:ABC-three component system middle component 6 n=1 Tax=Roseiconus lacunae TaxID=2605694 RepID=UPI0036F39F20